MTTTATRTRLSDIADHTHVTVEAAITRVTPVHPGTRCEWAILTVTDDSTSVDVRVYATAFRRTWQHLTEGSRVAVSGEVACDPDGLFICARTINQAGATA